MIIRNEWWVIKDTELEKHKQKIQEEIVRYIAQYDCSSDDEIYEAIEQKVIETGYSVFFSAEEKRYIVRSVYNSIRGLDILQDILENPEITEIMVNGYDHIFIEQKGRITEYPKHFESVEKLEDVIQLIVAKVNRMVNEANPIVDVRLMDGSRVNIVLPPVALNGPIVTIRKFPDKPITMKELIKIGSITVDAMNFLKTLVVARYNIFISGGTGSGKTTFLNALSNYIPSDERIITIEDSAELQIRGIPNLVKLEVRNANVEGKNAITIRDLLKSALRMRPDRIILGEVRDAAACELMSCMNTGHDGSLSTGHANSTLDMLHRLETLVLMGMDIPLPAVRSQIASAIDIVVQLGRLRDKSRKVLEIAEVIGIEDGEIKVQSLYKFVEEGEDADGKISGRLLPTGNRFVHRDKLIHAGLSVGME